MMGRTRFFTVSLGLTAVFASTAQADLALDLITGATFVRGTFANFGYTFETDAPVRVEALGLWDQYANGLVDEHPVGLWDAAGNLLASAIVDGASTPVASVNAAHVWRFTDIAPIQLEPGAYKLGAFYPTSADPFVGSSPDLAAQLVLAPGVSFGQAYVTVGGTEFFTEPDALSSATPGFFGPNAVFTAVPEPASAALLLAGLLVARRRA